MAVDFAKKPLSLKLIRDRAGKFNATWDPEGFKKEEETKARNKLVRLNNPLEFGLEVESKRFASEAEKKRKEYLDHMQGLSYYGIPEALEAIYPNTDIFKPTEVKDVIHESKFAIITNSTVDTASETLKSAAAESIALVSELTGKGSKVLWKNARAEGSVLGKIAAEQFGIRDTKTEDPKHAGSEDSTKLESGDKKKMQKQDYRNAERAKARQRALNIDTEYNTRLLGEKGLTLDMIAQTRGGNVAIDTKHIDNRYMVHESLRSQQKGTLVDLPGPKNKKRELNAGQQIALINSTGADESGTSTRQG